MAEVPERQSSGWLASVILILNLVVSSASLSFLVLYQRPVFSAQAELANLDAIVRRVEGAVAAQKNELEIMRATIGATEGIIKLVQDITPMISISPAATDFNANDNTVSVTWELENIGAYTINVDVSPELVVTKRIVSSNDPKSDVRVRDVVLPGPLGALYPKSKVRQIISFTLVDGSRDLALYFRIKASTDPRMVRLTAKLLGDRYAGEILPDGVFSHWITVRLIKG